MRAKMDTNTLYRSYLAQTAIIKAMNRAEVGVSGNSVGLKVGKNDYQAKGLKAAIDSGDGVIYRAKTPGLSTTYSEISIFADAWHPTQGDNAYRGRKLERLKQEVPGEFVVQVEDDGDRVIFGIVHGVTYSIRMGNTGGVN